MMQPDDSRLINSRSGLLVPDDRELTRLVTALETGAPV
jgi:hypothetical protein